MITKIILTASLMQGVCNTGMFAHQTTAGTAAATAATATAATAATSSTAASTTTVASIETQINQGNKAGANDATTTITLDKACDAASSWVSNTLYLLNKGGLITNAQLPQAIAIAKTAHDKDGGAHDVLTAKTTTAPSAS